jgi:hypothetical protein
MCRDGNSSTNRSTTGGAQYLEAGWLGGSCKTIEIQCSLFAHWHTNTVSIIDQSYCEIEILPWFYQ